MRTVLVTGGSGFFGGFLARTLLARGFRVLNVDLAEDPQRHPHLRSLRGDIRDRAALERFTAGETLDGIFHCAAILAHAVKDQRFLWSSNVDGTAALADFARSRKVPKIVFTSSNCLWGHGLGRPVTEDDPPAPVEIYGRSKWEGERILSARTGEVPSVILRTPTILEAGRLGLLSILFEFIAEGRRVWVVGGGKNRYQFVAASDLADACIRALDFAGSAVFNVGSDSVKSFREVYQSVIDRAGTGARVTSVPRAPAVLAMQLAYALRISPLGPYQYRMIAEDFTFDTTRIKQRLGWHPTLTNEEMLWRAFAYYRDHRAEIEARSGVSAHRQAASMGVIRLLKWMS